MLATFFHLVPPQVSLAVDLVSLAVVGIVLGVRHHRHQAIGRRDLPVSADVTTPAGPAEDDKVLVGID